MKENPDNYTKEAEKFSKKLKQLHLQRRNGKLKNPRTAKLSKKQRQEVLNKTNSKCHICGIDLLIDNFQADHVKSHVSGGSSMVDNYLPSCGTCNNYRWHYLPEEIQWILKIGVWAKTQIERETIVGKVVAEGSDVEEVLIVLCECSARRF